MAQSGRSVGSILFAGAALVIGSFAAALTQAAPMLSGADWDMWRWATGAMFGIAFAAAAAAVVLALDPEKKSVRVIAPGVAFVIGLVGFPLIVPSQEEPTEAVAKDSDGDGIPDKVEFEDAEQPGVGLDADGDGEPNIYDADANGDGVPDGEQGRGDSDRDGVPDYLDMDQ